MSWADPHDRSGEGEQTLGEHEPALQHLNGGRSTGAEDGKIEAAREDVLPALENDHGLVVDRLIQCAMDFRLHVRRQDVCLAIVHRDRGDGISARIGDETHDSSAFQRRHVLAAGSTSVWPIGSTPIPPSRRLTVA